jgi:hypothetical protein
MIKLFVTYGNGYKQRNSYSVVEGETLKDCYEQIDKATNGKYAFTYDTESFAGQIEKYGLTEIPLQAQTL